MTVEETPLRIARLRLKRGDVLLAKCKGRISREAALKLNRRILAKLPAGVRVLVIDASVEFAVVSPVAPSQCGTRRTENREQI